MGRVHKDCRDVYYRRAKDECFRARSAYKLQELALSFDLFGVRNEGKRVSRVIDLCAAPGSWSQVVRNYLNRPTDSIVAVDLQEMAPIDGVITLQGDISSTSTLRAIASHFENGAAKADLVISDGAPDATGLHEVDEVLQLDLLMAALRVCMFLLKPGGSFVAKIFKGPRYGMLFRTLFLLFESVYNFKPASSRSSSAEHFIVCQGFRNPPFEIGSPDDWPLSTFRRQLNILLHEPSPAFSHVAFEH